MTEKLIKANLKIQADNWIEEEKQRRAEAERHARNTELQKFVLLGAGIVTAVYAAVQFVEWMRG